MGSEVSPYIRSYAESTIMAEPYEAALYNPGRDLEGPIPTSVTPAAK